jgi:hypothetical protein
MNLRLRDVLRSVLAVAAGCLFVAAFYEIEQTVIGRHISFGGSWAEAPRSQIYFWVAATFLLLPGAACIAAGLVRPFATAFFGEGGVGGEGGKVAPEQATKPESRRAGALAAVAGVVATVVFAILNRTVFLEFPFTDDEWGARFGGELLADGTVAVPAPEWFPLIPDLFLHLREGFVTSFDWLGAMVPWAIANATGAGNLVFALAAGATAGALGWLAGREWGWRCGLAAALLFVASPMALTLSATTHTHVWSRCWLALALALWFAAHQAGGEIATEAERTTWGLWAASGAAAGMAWITRPIEVTALLGPLVAWRIVDVARRRGRAEVLGVGAFLAAGGVFVAAFIAHNLTVTGTVLPARLAGTNELVFPGAEHYAPALAIFGDWELLRTRFGANLGYNAMMFGVYGLSLPGMVLAVFGVRDATTRALAAGIGAAFAVAMFHDDYGLHMVGPIHYADAFVPFLVLVVSGLHRTVQWCGEHGIAGRPVAAGFVLTMLIWGGVFSSEHLRGIRRQSLIHQEIYDVVDASPNAIILADRYHEVWQALPDRGTGSYVFDWRKDLGTPERALVVTWSPANRKLYPALFDAFPERDIYRLRVTGDPPRLVLKPFPRSPRGL